MKTGIHARTLLPARQHDGLFRLKQIEDGRTICVMQAGCHGYDPDWWEFVPPDVTPGADVKAHDMPALPQTFARYRLEGTFEGFVESQGILLAKVKVRRRVFAGDEMTDEIGTVHYRRAEEIIVAATTKPTA